MKKDHQAHIYEQIAQVYLDNKKKTQSNNFLFKSLIGLGIFLTLFVTSIINFTYKPKQINLTSVANVEALSFDSHEIIRLNFNFDNFKNETYSLQFDGLDLSKYTNLIFYVRKAKLTGVVNLRVEIEDTNKIKSFLLIHKIENAWQEYNINLKDFKEIKNWKKITQLSFSVEDWFTQEKKDVVYIDRIKFTKSR